MRVPSLTTAVNTCGGPRPDQVTSLGFVFFVCVALEFRDLSMLGECSASELTPSRSIQSIPLYGYVGVQLLATQECFGPLLQRGLGETEGSAARLEDIPV